MHDGVEQAACEHPVDFRQVALERGLRRLAAEQAFERLQDERQLDAHQHVPLDPLSLDGHGDRVCWQLRLRRRPRVLADVGEDDLDFGVQLAGQRAAERLAKGVERADDPSPQLGRELGRLGEVERADLLVGACVPGADGVLARRLLRHRTLRLLLARAHARLRPSRRTIRLRPPTQRPPACEPRTPSALPAPRRRRARPTSMARPRSRARARIGRPGSR